MRDTHSSLNRPIFLRVILGVIAGGGPPKPSIQIPNARAGGEATARQGSLVQQAETFPLPDT